jgi:hypothetical protein
MLEKEPKTDIWIFAGIGMLLIAGTAQVLTWNTTGQAPGPSFSASPSASPSVAPSASPSVAPSVSPSVALSPFPSVTPSVEAPGIDDPIPSDTPSVSTETQSAQVLRILVPGTCKLPNKKLTECTGAQLRRTTNKNATVDHFVLNGTQIVVRKSVGAIAQVEIIDDNGVPTGKIGWIESQYIVPGS